MVSVTGYHNCRPGRSSDQVVPARMDGTSRCRLLACVVPVYGPGRRLGAKRGGHMSSSTSSVEFVADPEHVASMTSPRPVGHGPVRAYDWIAHHTRQRPHKEAVRDLGSGRSFTYVELDRRVDAMAAYLASIGVGRGDRVGVLAHNGVEYFDVQFACARRGAICVLLNWRLTV